MKKSIKAKRVSIYLSLLTMLQLIFIGAGGAFAHEFFAGFPKAWVAVLLGLAIEVAAILAIILYSFLFNRTSK
jgi:xanthine/uracil permease